MKRSERRKEPLAVALVVVNLFLGGAVVYRYMARRDAPRLPPGHPDVSEPASLPAEAAMGSGAGNPAISPDFAAIELAAKGEAPASDFAISGTVSLSPKLKEPWPQGASVFVIARSDAGGGPPFAVRRYDGVKPPFKFSLGPDNEMLGGEAPKRLMISVRVDQDGDAMTRQLGDLEGGPSAPVPAHASVDVVIDRPIELAPAP